MTKNLSTFDRPAAAPWWVIVVVVVGNSVLDLVLMTHPAANALRWVSAHTHGLVRPALVMCAIEATVLILGVIILAGKMKWSHVGLDRRRFLPGIIFVFGLWATVQVVTMLSEALSGGSVVLHLQWTQRPMQAIGHVVADWLGVAAYEETVFRGFLLTQLWVHLDRRAARLRWGTLGLAVLLSQAFFALGHIPYLMHHGTEWGRIPLDMAYLLALGVLFSVVYLSTSNLFVAMAVHAMFNSPALICDVPASLALTTVVVVALFLVVPIALRQRWRARSRDSCAPLHLE